MPSTKFRLLTFLAAIAFLLNFLWEMAQAPLFSMFVSYRQHLAKCLVASVGDVAVVLLLYLFISLLRNDFFWINYIRAIDVLIVVALGSAFAIVFEKWALATTRWNYGQAMPLIPVFRVALLPVIQMALLPLSSYLLAGLLYKRTSVE